MAMKRSSGCHSGVALSLWKLFLSRRAIRELGSKGWQELSWNQSWRPIENSTPEGNQNLLTGQPSCACCLRHILMSHPVAQNSCHLYELSHCVCRLMCSWRKRHNCYSVRRLTGRVLLSCKAKGSRPSHNFHLVFHPSPVQGSVF